MAGNILKTVESLRGGNSIETDGIPPRFILLNQLISKKKVAGKQILVTPSHIVQRQSSDILAIDDTEVARAIHYIMRSIYNEIQQVRAEWISKLPLETDPPISQITSSFNLTDCEHISRFFKKEKGIGLLEFRKFHKSLRFPASTHFG